MDNATNYRAPLIMEPSFSSSSNVMRTPFGNVHTSSNQSPPLPPPPSTNMTESYNTGYSSGFGNYNNSYGGYGSNFGGYGMSPYGNSGFGGGMFGSGMYGGGFGSYNRGGMFGGGGSFLNPYDPESRFIQIAEENSRPAFESIGSLVSAFANIATMLDSTFYAITSSFHAILGVAANFGRLRGVFSQFWQTFAIFRGLTWTYKKLLYWLKISNIDPSSQVFKEAFEAAKNEAFNNGVHDRQNFNKPPKQSPWPVIVFLGFIFTAPYIVMKLLGNLTTSAVQETKDPRRWVKPIKSIALYDFAARSPSELTIKAGQTVYIAPKEIQNTQKLLNTGWAIATVDAIHSGLIPITYCKKVTNNPIETFSANSQNVAGAGVSSEIPIPLKEETKIFSDETDKTNSIDININQQNEIISDFSKILENSTPAIESDEQ